MATTSVFNGTSLVVLIGTEVIGFATSCSLSLAIDTPDASTKQSLGWADEIGGQRSWSLTTDGLATVVPGATATYVSTAELNALAAFIEYIDPIESPVTASLLTLKIESIVLKVHSPVQAASAISPTIFRLYSNL